jgi:protein SCO1/2
MASVIQSTIAVRGLGIALAALSILLPGVATSQANAPGAIVSSPAPREQTGRAGPALDQAQALQLSQSAIGRYVGDYTLKNAEGRPVNLSSLHGKPLLVSFIYTGCFSVCPTTTRTLKGAVEAAQRTLGPDSFHVVSVGFNLPFDTPQAMGTYARQQGVYLPNWLFLSPDPATLERLTRDLGFTYQPAAGGFDHITQVTVIDQNGRVYRQVYGDSFPLPQLVGPLKELLTGSPPANESLAGLLERVRLLCTAYDPVTGQYRYKTSILFEITGGAIGLTLIAWFFLRELRKTRRLRAG